MAGFAAAIGGMAQPAMQLGQQIRSLLESRRSQLAQAMFHLAEGQSGPKRDEYIQHGTDLLQGKKQVDQILPKVIKTVQDHIEGNHALAQAVGGAPQQEKPSPGPGTGIPGATPSPGQDLSTSGLTPAPSANPPAAQPATSLVQPTQQSQAQGPQSMLPPGLPQPQGAMAIRQKWEPFLQDEPSRAAYGPIVMAEIQHDQALQQQQEQLLTQLGLRKQTLERMEPSLAAIPGPMGAFTRAGYEAQTGGMTPINMPYSLMGVHQTPIDVTNMTPEQKAQMGLPPTATGPQMVDIDRMGNVGQAVGPRYVPPVTAQTPGGMGEFSRTSGKKIADLEGATPPSFNTPHPVIMPDLTTAFQNYRGAEAGTAPTSTGGVSPLAFPTAGTSQRSISTVDPTTGMPVTALEPVGTMNKRLPLTGPGGTVAPHAGAGVGPSAPREFYKPLTASTQSMREAAPKVSDLVDRIYKLVDQQSSTLGPLASRWQEFFSGKVGSPNPEFTKLRSDTMLLQTLLIKMHLGSRGGVQMMNHFKSILDSGRQSPENMKAALGEIKAYADSVRSETPAEVNPKTPTGSGTPITITLPSGKKVVIE